MFKESMSKIADMSEMGMGGGSESLFLNICFFLLKQKNLSSNYIKICIFYLLPNTNSVAYSPACYIHQAIIDEQPQ